MTILHATIVLLLSVGALHAQDDRRRVAEAAVAEGKRLQAQATAESLRGAQANFEKALASWRALGDRQNEAETLGLLLTVHHNLGDHQKVLDLLQQQLALWQAIGDRPRETAEALTNIGTMHAEMGQQQKALDAFQEALSLGRTIGDRLGLARTLVQFGLFHIRWGEFQKASDYCHEALATFRELGDRQGLANTLNNLGGINNLRGDYRKSLDYHLQALEFYRALGRRPEEAVVLNNIGRVYALLGEPQKALDYYRQALPLRQAIGNRAQEGAQLNNIGLVYESLGERQKALEHYERALDLFRASKDRNLEGYALHNIGAFHLNALKDPKTALDYFNQALQIRRGPAQPIEQAATLDNIGLAYQRSGDLPRALEHHRQALEMRRASGHRPGEAASLYNLGDTYVAMRDVETALDYFNQALRLNRAMGSREAEAATLYGIARIERDRGNLEAALARMEEPLRIIESMRGHLSSQELRASFLAEQHEYFGFYTDLLMRLHERAPAAGHDAAAFHASERARARSLLELLAEARIDLDQGIAPELKTRERDTHSRIAWVQRRLIDAYSQPKPDQGRITTLEAELKELDERRERLKVEIRQKHPRYADLHYPAPPGLKQIQALLDEDTLLLEYALGTESAFLFAVSKNAFLPARLSSSPAIASQVEALRAHLAARPQRSAFGNQIDVSRSLYRELIQPAAKLLPGKRKLVVIPSGILHYLPFEVLLSPGGTKNLETAAPDRWPYLLNDYAISYVPSAGVLAGLRDRAPSAWQKSFLAFANPRVVNGKATDVRVADDGRGAFGQQTWNLGPLPESRREVEQIAGLYPKDGVSIMLGEQATEENAKTSGRFDGYRYVHFATHGLLNEERPSYSGLILSLVGTTAGAQTEDGLLQVYEIFNLRLNADLVVLSACETGLGKQVEGEGLVGLTQAFFYAGTPSVLMSLWKVQDRSTADLMVNFYQQLNRKQGKAEAMREAKLQLIQQKRYAHPYYWAPFILTGDPR